MVRVVLFSLSLRCSWPFIIFVEDVGITIRTLPRSFLLNIFLSPQSLYVQISLPFVFVFGSMVDST